MIGFLIGAVCLIGLVKTIRRGRHGWGGHHHHGWGGHSCGGGGYGGYGGWGGEGRRGYGGRGPRMFLRGLFERLDTSPGQEKVILSAMEQLWEKKRSVGEEFVKTRSDVARAMRGERFDEVALNEAFTRQDALLTELRQNVEQSLKAIHEALDERQRKIAGDLFEGGGFGRHGGGFGGGGPYRNTQSWV